MNTTAILPDAVPTPNGQDGQPTTAIPGEATFPATGTSSQGTADPAQQWAQPAPQAPQGAPQAAPNPETTRIFSIVSFVLGIASVVSSWTFIAPITGLVFGILALRRGTSERTLTLWGIWLNAIMLALTAIGILIGVVFLGVGLLAAPFAWI
ncbi:hypothetical protein FM113_11000 [Leucobacter sp. 7(1)]|uniref:DUF4190 domain-containing protein n=1 Tax=Leucobacter sp. 7(1) TaxID=1255613 RepID=UPI00097F0BDB|nr:DUF4190 domain-containing protein [Leucobacter sp. 7(1)]SJN11116.1 hypothetical protein FM113_11000 [Leucobacter sp. 7(1)]